MMLLQSSTMRLKKITRMVKPIIRCTDLTKSSSPSAKPTLLRPTEGGRPVSLQGSPGEELASSPHAWRPRGSASRRPPEGGGGYTPYRGVYPPTTEGGRREADPRGRPHVSPMAIAISERSECFPPRCLVWSSRPDGLRPKHT